LGFSLGRYDFPLQLITSNLLDNHITLLAHFLHQIASIPVAMELTLSFCWFSFSTNAGLASAIFAILAPYTDT